MYPKETKLLQAICHECLGIPPLHPTLYTLQTT